MNVLIVGAGAMGSWFAGVLDEHAELSFADIDTEAANAAARRYGGRVVSTESQDSFDVVCLAVPISAVSDAVSAYAPQAEQALLDLSGHMAEPVDAMRAAVPELERISLHPLFAPENAPGNVPAVVENGGEVARRILDRLSAAGCRVIETTVEEHDQAMETIQAKAHAALLAYALVADPVPDGYETPISAGLDALLDGLLGGTPRVYAEIQSQFSGADELADAAATIASADRDRFETLYREAATRRGEGAYESS